MAGCLSFGRGGGGGGAEGGRRELNVQDAAGWRVPESVINDSLTANESLMCRVRRERARTCFIKP